MSEIVVRTREDVHCWLDAIRASTGDPEGAHSAEDALHRAVLRAVADGIATEPRSMARLALTTLDLDFPRWAA